MQFPFSGKKIKKNQVKIETNKLAFENTKKTILDSARDLTLRNPQKTATNPILPNC